MNPDGGGKGVRNEWHCRLLCKGLGHAAAVRSSLARVRGLVSKASSFGLRLLALGSTLSGRMPTNSLELVCWPHSINSAVSETLGSSQLLASNCWVVVKLKVRGMRPLDEQLCNIFMRIRL